MFRSGYTTMKTTVLLLIALGITYCFIAPAFLFLSQSEVIRGFVARMHAQNSELMIVEEASATDGAAGAAPAPSRRRSPGALVAGFFSR
jgi:hypothetical protein